MSGFGRLQAALYDPLMAQAERGWLGALRDELVGAATGETLEIGAGTGLNVPRYRTPTRLVVTEPQPTMLRYLRPRVEQAHVPVSVEEASGETLPFPDDSFDTVVSTLVLCSVERPAPVVAELRRVLRPGGHYLFLEHGGAHDPRLARWQRRLEPVWKRLAGGCRLTRDAEQLVAANGFSIVDLASHEPPRSGVMKPFRLGRAT
jgi:ubiquinone/menaquinone biosynthesis C-methylase UbiE